jgi:serine/threonine protein phosphatase PrpC
LVWIFGEKGYYDEYPFQSLRRCTTVLEHGKADRKQYKYWSSCLHIECSAQSDQGMIRTSNEDVYIADVKSCVFLVADGMGGHAAGEIASQITASAVEKVLSDRDPEENVEDLLQRAVRYANKRVYETQEQKPECQGMGSTLTVLTFRETHYYLAQVGDSRAYLCRDNKLNQLTRDHSVVWSLFESGILTKDDISRHPQKNLITRSIGTHPEVEIDLLAGTTAEGDIYLLCSDGLTDVLSDQDILQIIESNNKNPKKIGKSLIDAANNGGGPDNVTIVVVYLAP